MQEELSEEDKTRVSQIDYLLAEHPDRYVTLINFRPLNQAELAQYITSTTDTKFEPVPITIPMDEARDIVFQAIGKTQIGAKRMVFAFSPQTPEAKDFIMRLYLVANDICHLADDGHTDVNHLLLHSAHKDENDLYTISLTVENEDLDKFLELFEKIIKGEDIGKLIPKKPPQISILANQLESRFRELIPELENFGIFYYYDETPPINDPEPKNGHIKIELNRMVAAMLFGKKGKDGTYSAINGNIVPEDFSVEAFPCDENDDTKIHYHRIEYILTSNSYNEIVVLFSSLLEKLNNLEELPVRDQLAILSDYNGAEKKFLPDEIGVISPDKEVDWQHKLSENLRILAAIFLTTSAIITFFLVRKDLKENSDRQDTLPEITETQQANLTGKLKEFEREKDEEKGDAKAR